jgi:hypothetical protein
MDYEEEETEKEPIDDDYYENQNGFVRKNQPRDEVQRKDTPEDNMHRWYK